MGAGKQLRTVYYAGLYLKQNLPEAFVTFFGNEMMISNITIKSITINYDISHLNW
jgi:hypothetical protein